MENMLEKIIGFIFVPRLKRIENKIGYRLSFQNIPDTFINGIVGVDETATWNKFRLDLEAGANYWTIGKLENGISTRYNPDSPEYQSWLGGYLVKLAHPQKWKVEDHFKLAIADQNSWLKTEGDHNPTTTTEGWKFTKVEDMKIGSYSGVLYEGGCTTHSDIGKGNTGVVFFLESLGITALFNFSNPQLKLKPSMFMPRTPQNVYEILKLHGYIGIFDIDEKVKVVLYGNGAEFRKGDVETDTFLSLKTDLLQAMKSCQIIKI